MKFYLFRNCLIPYKPISRKLVFYTEIKNSLPIRNRLCWQNLLFISLFHQTHQTGKFLKLISMESAVWMENYETLKFVNPSEQRNTNNPQ